MANTTREQHLQWCKDRANALNDSGDGKQAIDSMLSDLGKHPETENSQMIAAMLGMSTNPNDKAAVRKFINGFN